MLRDLAVICDVVLLAALLTITLNISKGKSVSISEHAASSRWSYWLFAITLTIFGSIFSLYLVFYLGPQFNLSPLYYAAAIIGWIALVLAAWFAEDTKKPRFKNPHWLSANALGAMMGVMLVCISITSSVNPVTRVLAAIFAAWYFFCLYLIFFREDAKLLNHFMPIQYFNILTFTSLVLAASYFS